MDPQAQPGMPDLNIEERKTALASLGLESRLARDERKRGIVMESLPCPLLIVKGTKSKWSIEWRSGGDDHTVDGASHWGLVMSRRSVASTAHAVVRWLGRQFEEGACPRSRIGR